MNSFDTVLNFSSEFRLCCAMLVLQLRVSRYSWWGSLSDLQPVFFKDIRAIDDPHGIFLKIY